MVSHFLAGRLHGERITYRPYGAVKVELVKHRPPTLRVVPGSICLVKASVYLALLPESVIVVDDADEQIPASGKFYISTESIDPYHLLIDALDGNRPF